LLDECAVGLQIFDRRAMPRLKRFMEPFVENCVGST